MNTKNIYVATNIGFGLPTGRFFKVELCPDHGPALYFKIGGAEYPADAKTFSLNLPGVAGHLKKHGGLRSSRVNEINQHEAVLSNASANFSTS